MANFNFGHIGAAIEAGKVAAANMDIGPINSLQYSSENNVFYNYAMAADRKNRLGGFPQDFIWGQKWGNKKTRVTK